MNEIQIVAATMFIVAVYLAGYLFQKRSEGSAELPIQPASVVIVGILVLLLTAAITIFIKPEYILLAVALSLGAVVSVIHPVIAVSFLLSLILIRPWEFYENELLKNSLRPAAFLAIFSWIIFALKSKRLFIYWSWWIGCFVLLLVWFAIAGVLSADWKVGWDFFFTQFFPTIVTSLLILNCVVNRADLVALKATLVLSITGLIAAALYYTASNPKLAENRLFTTSPMFGNANDLGALIAIAMPLAFFWLLKKGKSGDRRWFIALPVFTILFWGLFKSQSRGTMLGIGAGALAYFLFCGKMKAKRAVFILLIFIAGSLLFDKVLSQRTDLEISSTSRWNYVIAGFNMLKAHPVLGVGLNHYSDEYERYTPSFEEYGKRTAHSSWVLAMAETGAIGIFLFALTYFSAAFSAWKVRRIVPEYFVIIVSYGVCMSFLSHTYIILPYLVCVLAVVASRIVKQENIRL